MKRAKLIYSLLILPTVIFPVYSVFYFHRKGNFMARPGVTYQDIVTAVNELKAQQINITIENIRAHLGTGSIGTINKYLRQWREMQASTTRFTIKENLEVLMQSLQRYEFLEADYQREIADLKRELEKYRINNQRWQKLFQEWQNEKLALEKALNRELVE